MKLQFSFKMFTLLLAGSLFFTSCGDDTLDTPTSLNFVSGTGYLTADANVVPGEVFTVNVKATAGDNPLKTLTIKDNNSTISVSTDRLTIDGSAANVNPILLAGADKTSFDYVIGIKAHSGNEARNYTFEVADDAGNISTLTLKITVAATPVTTLTGILFNQSGPAGTGGLNLLTGESTGTQAADVNSQIRDMGIDSSSTVTGTWKQKVGSLNGSVLKYIKKGQNGVAENFSFGGVAYKEELASLWEKGSASFTVSEKVNVGDFIMVFHKNTYFLIEVKEINVTTNNNADNYKFDIKY
jgi:hypothetical protein